MSEECIELPEWAIGLFAVYIVVALIWSLLNFFVWWMGPCPAFSSNTDCEWTTFKTLWHFPLTQVVAVLLGILLLFFLRKKFGRPSSDDPRF